MFSEMLRNLAGGEMPEPASLKRRLAAALDKKGGILQQPKPCWSSDPKINPQGKYLLWAAVLLQDDEALAVAAGLMSYELQAREPRLAGADLQVRLRAELAAMGEIAPTPEFRQRLLELVSRASLLLPGA